MAQEWLKKYLRMKPEVKKIFEDLEEWHDHCRWALIRFEPRDLYRSREYKEFARSKKANSQK
jgi:hypothetical protein